MPELTGSRRCSCCPTDGPLRHLLHRPRRARRRGLRRRRRRLPAQAGRGGAAAARRWSARAMRDARRRFATSWRALPPRRASTPDRPLDRLALPTRQGIVLLDPRRCRTPSSTASWSPSTPPRASTCPTCRCRSCESRLPADRFARVHRRALLNLEHVVRLEPRRDRRLHRAHARRPRRRGLAPGRARAAPPPRPAARLGQECRDSCPDTPRLPE